MEHPATMLLESACVCQGGEESSVTKVHACSQTVELQTLVDGVCPFSLKDVFTIFFLHPS